MAYPEKPSGNYTLRSYNFAEDDTSKTPMDEYLFKHGYKNADESELESVPDAHEQNWLFDILHRNLRYAIGVAEENKTLLSGKVATTTTLGQVIVKDGLSVASNGELSVNSDIRTKVATIPTLRSDIDTNTENIATNTENITTNANNIATNANDIAGLKQEDININNTLTNKANRDLSNCTLLTDIYPVIQSVNTGSANYVISSDKRCVQVGTINFTATTQNLIFPKPFRDTNYFLFLTDKGSARVSYGYSNTDKTYATCYSASVGNSASYIAIGYVD